MASVKVKFRPSTVDGKAGSVYYQVIHKGQVRQISTDYSLLPGEWDEKSGCVVFPVENKRRDDEVRTVVERMRWDQNRLRHIIRTLEDEQGNFTSEDVVTEFQQQRLRASLFGFMRHMADELRDMGRFRTAEAYRATLNSFMRFRAGKDLPVDALSAEMVKRYEACLKKKMLSLNTISFYMRILRAAYNRGTADGKARHDHPFKDVYTSIEKTRKRAIPVRMVKALRELDLSMKPSTELARDLFLFSFFTRGMSFVDMAFLQKKNLKDGVLTYRRRKTGQLLTIKWERCMEEIVRKHPNNQTDYLLPIITSTEDEWRQYRNGLHLVNNRLHMLAGQIGLEQPLTMYVARHSWATAAKMKQIPLSVISQGLGHNSQVTTQIYLAALEASVVDKANRQIISLV